MRASLGVVHAVGDEWLTPAGGRVDRYVQTDIGLQPGFSGSLPKARPKAASTLLA